MLLGLTKETRNRGFNATPGMADLEFGTAERDTAMCEVFEG